jgi:hypothetical protein
MALPLASYVTLQDTLANHIALKTKSPNPTERRQKARQNAPNARGTAGKDRIFVVVHGPAR